MAESMQNVILTSYPEPIALCYHNFLKEEEAAKKYQKMLNLFDTTMRFLSIVAIIDYFQYATAQEKINQIMRDNLDQAEYYAWHKYFIEIIMTDNKMIGQFFAPELMSICHKNYDKCSEMIFIIEEFLSLLTPDNVKIELADTEFPELLNHYKPKLFAFLSHVEFLKNFSPVRFLGKGEQENSGQFDLYRGTQQTTVTLEVEHPSEFESENIYLFDRNRQKFLNLFPFIVKQRCDKCLGEHFFFYNGMSNQQTLLYVDFDLNHYMSLQNSESLCALGQFYVQKRLFRLAEEKYEGAFEVNQGSEKAKNGLIFCSEKLGNLYYQKDNFYRAIKKYEDALRLEPDIPRVLFNLSLAYKKLKEFDQAISILSELIKKYPNYYRAFEILGYLYEEKGMYAKALFYYNRFLKHEPNHQGLFERRKLIMKKVEVQAKEEKSAAKTSTSDEKTLTFEEMVVDITKEASDEKFKPLIGRDRELHELIEVLSCMKKNNPLIVGEPGVGKTSLVEELARRIVLGEVPHYLSSKRILQLQAATLLAGTKYRGQFEERIMMFVRELKRRKNCILFIDDLHTIISAGMTKGSSLDASNALKPELAKGEIQIIGICTYDEYRLYLEKDAAFERRFQIVKIPEPDQELCFEIVKGFKESFEKFHNVIIKENALKAVIDLPKIYLRDRYLPDKAIDLLDRSCAMVATNIVDTLDSPVNGILEVTEEDIIRTVSHLTRIPIAKIAHSHSHRFIKMEEALQTRIIGQDEAVQVVSEVIRTTKMDFDINPMRPDGVFLFVGPTGVGKTELARAMAEFLFGDEDKMLRVDMSEFTDDISTSKLIGITPGYVGYNDRNQLTDHVRNYPFSLILLDEVEKANRQVLNLFLQVFDCGRLTDGRGRTVYFNNTTFVMTSNIGAELFSRSKVGYGTPLDAQDSQFFHRNVSKGELLRVVKMTLPPEFINRIDEIVCFRALDKNDVKKIADLQLNILREKLKKDGKALILSDEALDLIVERGYSEQFGARNLTRIIRKMLLDPLAMRSLQPEWESTLTIEVDAIDEELKID
ncbi:AAA family ATPase [candidate division CSSED10-310 bacterium]|uniref:AAA family ATPase n=1 Tax=candidate division CSSED10-310 bacterium TaxID=2855610 RepID=A0ABV6YXZ2_UNCC1